jgi:hypothetical protein
MPSHTGSTWTYFDIQNGVVGSNNGTAPYATSLTAQDSGYYQISVSCYAGANLAANNIALYLATGNGTNSYTGNGTSGILVRKVEISEGGSPL